MARKIADCRRFESDTHCSLTIIGEEDEVSTPPHSTRRRTATSDTPDLHFRSYAGCSSRRTATSPGHASPGPFPS